MKRILLIDDERSFRDGRPATVCRGSKAGLDVLEAWPRRHWDELWLDHDLGEGDDVMRVVDELCRFSFEGAPLAVDLIFVHTQNPVGAQNILRSLDRYGYRAKRVGVDAFIVPYTLSMRIRLAFRRLLARLRAWRRGRAGVG